ncbi:SGNH/GDSL hydrolase family protein [Candidatus Omnitrophota bacterium]
MSADRIQGGVSIKKASALFLSVIITLALLLAAGELYALWKYNQPYLSGFMLSHSDFHHIPPAYFEGTMHSEGDFNIPFRTNNRGMRGPGDYAYKKERGVFRIVVLGDSFVFGVGVEARETASSVLEDLLNSGNDKKYEVLNFGVNSYSPLLEYIYLKEEAIKYRPDAVILMLDLCDIQDDYFYEPHVTYKAGGEIAGCDPFKVNGNPDVWAFCKKYSRLFNILDQKLFQSFRKVKAIGFVNYLSNKLKGIRNKTEILANKDIDNIYFDRFLLVREGKNKDVVSRHWKRTARYLKMIKGYLDREKIPLVLVTYPYGHLVGEGQWEKGRIYWGFKQGETYNAQSGFSLINDFARENGIELVNALDPLIQNNHEALYYNNDGHLTKRGQEVVAATIFNSGPFRRQKNRRKPIEPIKN